MRVERRVAAAALACGLLCGCAPIIGGIVLGSGSSSGGGGGGGGGPAPSTAFTTRALNEPEVSATNGGLAEFFLESLPPGVTAGSIRVSVWAGESDVRLAPGDFFFNDYLFGNSPGPSRYSLCVQLPPCQQGNLSTGGVLRVRGSLRVLSTAGSSDALFGYASEAMQVTAVTPDGGPVDGGRITIAGEGFAGNMQVRVADTEGIIESQTGDELVVRVQALPQGVHTIAVIHPDGYRNEGFTYEARIVPTVTVTAPAFGQVVAGTFTLDWTTLDDNPSSVELRLSSDSGATYPTVIAAGVSDLGSYSWDSTTVPDGTTYRLKVIATDGDGYAGEDETAGDFTIDNTGPRVVTARYEDQNRTSAVDVGDFVVVVFDEDVVVSGATAADLALPVAGDSFGSGATLTAGPQANEVRITLGTGPSLTITGAFAAGTLTAGSPSGLDVAAALGPDEIESAVTGVDATSSSFVDLARSSLVAGQALPTSTLDVELADLDGDGDLDLALAGWQSEGVRLLENDGGTFVERHHWQQDGTNYVVEVEDLDGDGDLDVYFPSAGPSVYFNEGAWSFTAGSQFINGDYAELGDVDGDGDLDAVSGAGGVGFYVLKNDGAGTFSAGSVLDADFTQAVDLGDLDGDGDLDLIRIAFVGSTAGRRVERWLNDGTGAYGSYVELVTADSLATAELGDLDGDGDLDLVLSSNDATTPGVLRLINDGTATFSALPRITDAAGWCASLGDYDGDGDLDIITGHRIWLNDGLGGYRDSSLRLQTSTSYVARSGCLGDIDGDGDADLVIGFWFPAPGTPGRVYRNTLIGD